MADLHLVDATYELFRAYHAMPSRRGVDGAPVGAVYGLVSMMIAFLRERRVTHVACATDHVVRSFRNERFAGYKTEAGVPADLLAQFEPAETAMRALGLVVWPMVEFEADDAIATAVHRYAGDFDTTYVCATDKDLAQTVRDRRVVLLDRRKGEVLDEDAIRAKYGVGPASIPDLLALVGDAADGLPGIPRWGAKSAAAVLSVYGRIEDVPADPAGWRTKVRGAAALAKSLNERRADALLYKELATLRTDVPLAESAADLEWKGVPPTFAEYCGQMGFDRLAERAEKIRQA